MTKSSKRVYDIQCELYKAINTELTGLEIMRPHAITQGTKTTAAKSNGPYQPLTLNRQSDEKCTDYYVVMTSNRIVSSEHDSDVSGESNTSENLSLLEQHNTRVEDRLGRTVEELHSLRAEVAKLQTFTEHLRNRCDSLQAQMRMMGSEKMTNGIDSRGPASLPGEGCMLLIPQAPPTKWDVHVVHTVVVLLRRAHYLLTIPLHVHVRIVTSQYHGTHAPHM